MPLRNGKLVNDQSPKRKTQFTGRLSVPLQRPRTEAPPPRRTLARRSHDCLRLLLRKVGTVPKTQTALCKYRYYTEVTASTDHRDRFED